jgi:Holliday junction resolvase RusA-like endonuclease
MMIAVALKPLTFNGAYPTNKFGRRFLTNEGKKYKQILSKVSIEHLSHLIGYSGELHFRATIYGPFMTKKNTISKTAGDVDGFCKLLIDGICEPLNIDDSQIFYLEVKKVISPDWAIAFELFASPEN